MARPKSKRTQRRPPAAVRKLYESQVQLMGSSECTLLDSYTFEAHGAKAVAIFYRARARYPIDGNLYSVAYRIAIATPENGLRDVTGLIVAHRMERDEETEHLPGAISVGCSIGKHKLCQGTTVIDNDRTRVRCTCICHGEVEENA